MNNAVFKKNIDLIQIGLEYGAKCDESLIVEDFYFSTLQRLNLIDFYIKFYKYCYIPLCKLAPQEVVSHIFLSLVPTVSLNSVNQNIFNLFVTPSNNMEIDNPYLKIQRINQFIKDHENYIRLYAFAFTDLKIDGLVKNIKMILSDYKVAPINQVIQIEKLILRFLKISAEDGIKKNSLEKFNFHVKVLGKKVRVLDKEEYVLLNEAHKAYIQEVRKDWKDRLNKSRSLMIEQKSNYDFHMMR